MDCRVETDAPEEASSVVAEHPGCPRVHELVDGDGNDKRDNDRGKRPRIKISETRHQTALGSGLNRLELRGSAGSLLGAGTGIEMAGDVVTITLVREDGIDLSTNLHRVRASRMEVAA